jgi:hypothetical protein
MMVSLMSNIFYGIRRLLLLNTANYSLGNFPLDKPLSISAPNNRGKSTAINALQFPFLSDMKDMSFPRNNDDTRKYYFPYDSSYVVSEIITDNGTYVVGASGKGQASGYEYQLFAYKAPLDIEDFLIGNPEIPDREVRNFRELKIRLSKQNIWIRPLSPKQMRDALMGSQVTLPNNETFTIGVFRLRTRTEANFRLFFRIFKNLLHMNDVNLEEMKHLLLDALLPVEGSKTIDIMGRYAIQTEDITKAKANADTAARIADDVKRLAAAKEKLDLSCGILGKLFTPISKEYKTEKNLYTQKLSTIDEKMCLIPARKKEIQDSQTPLQQSLEEHAIKESNLKEKITAIKNGKTTFALFQPVKQQESHIQSLQNQYDTLIGELQHGQPQDRKEIEAELQSIPAQIKGLQHRLSVIDNNLLTSLIKDFNRSDIQLILKLFNRNILTSLPLGDDGVQILDQTKFTEMTGRLLSHCNGNYYNDGRLQIDLSRIQPINIDDYFNRELIQEEIDRLEKRTARLERNLEIAKNYQELEERKNALGLDITKKTQNLTNYKAFLQEQDKEEEYQKALITTQTAKAQISGDLKNITRQSEKIIEEEQSLTREREALQRSFADLDNRYNQIEPPSNTDLIGTAPDYTLPERLDDMLDAYHEAFNNKRSARTQIDQTLQLIESKNGLRFTSGNEENITIKELIDAIAGQDEYITQYQNFQKAFSQEMGALLKELTTRFDKFTLALRSFNRQVNSRPISNIKRIGFIIDEKNDIIRTIRNIVEQDSMFTNYNKVERAIRQLDELVTQKNVKLSLHNLFNMGIRVELQNGEVSTSFSDANIQSTGTGITVKIILNVVLLNSLLHTTKGQIITIPVYIDEAGQIDPANQQTLINQCRPTGFVPVFASVEPQATADYWITLTETDGHIYVAQDDWFHLSKRRDATGTDHA